MQERHLRTASNFRLTARQVTGREKNFSTGKSFARRSYPFSRHPDKNLTAR